MSKFLQIEDRIFTGWRLRLYGSGAVFIFVFLMTCAVIRHLWPFLPSGTPRCIDFGSIWLDGKLAAAGHAGRIFDYSAFSTAQLAFFGPENCINFNRFYYPPTFLFFTYPLGLMPYVVALAGWIIGSFVLYEAAIYAIVSRRTALILAAAPFFVAVNIDFGHTGFLSAGLMGLSLAFIERRPWLSGIFVGLLTYKPHFGLLFPIALLASRNWRVIAGATVATAVLGLSAAAAFGYEGWTSFIHALTDRSSGLAPAPGIEMRLHSVFGLLHWAGASTWVSWSAQLAVSAFVALAIGMLWAKPIPYNLKAAALAAGSLLVSPYVLFYDLCILSVAVAFLVKEGLSRGFLPAERTAIFVCWAAAFLGKLPLGAVICAALLCLVARRIRVYRKRDQPSAPAATGFGAHALTGD
jgi:arabinofuranan 3-O-arabinosyltransferase